MRFCSSGILRRVNWWLGTDVSGKSLGAVLGVLADGTDWFRLIPNGYTETSLTNYKSTLRKIPAELRSPVFLFSGQVISVMLPSLWPERHSEWVHSSRLCD
jgi:hypothetical protein